MEYVPPEGSHAMFQSQVKEGRENEGKYGGRQTADEGQAELKPRDADSYAPRHQY